MLNRIFATLLCGALFALAATADAQAAIISTSRSNIKRPSLAAPGDPIPGVGVGLDHDPGGSSIAVMNTNADGNVTFSNLAPGDYVLVIDGPSLVAAMDKLPVPAPEKKSSGGFSLGIGGGMFGGGGSRHSSSGGVASNGNGRDSAVGDGNHHSGNSRSGIFNSTNTTGEYDRASRDGNNPDSNPRTPGININPEWDHDLGNGDGQRMLEIGWDRHDASGDISFETPYCPDSAAQGVRIHFTVPPRPADSDYTGWYLGVGLGYSYP